MPEDGYDVEALRAHFPSLAGGTAYFDGPGGTQTPDVVGEAMRRAITQPLSNRGRLTPAERNADDTVLLIETVAPGDPGRRFTLGAGGRGEECISLVEIHGDLRAVIPDGTPRRFEVGPLSPAWLRARTSVAMLSPLVEVLVMVRRTVRVPGPPDRPGA